MSDKTNNVDEKLKMIRKLLDEEKQKKDDDDDNKINKKKLLDKDSDTKQQQQLKKKKNEKVKRQKEIVETTDETTDEDTDEYLTEYDVNFQLVVEINKIKLKYYKSVGKYLDTVIDSNILLFKNSDNKLIFPLLNVGLLNYELEQLREWKNKKVSLKLDDKDDTKVYNLFKKALLSDIYKSLESIFKKNTFVIKSVTAGKEYAKKEFLIFIEIENPVEKAKMVKFKTSKLEFGNDKVKPIGISINELIEMALKYNNNGIEINSEKNPFSPIVLLYLAELTYRQDHF